MKVDLTVACNVLVRGFQNDKEIYQYSTHNIWLDNGRDWLVKLIGYNMTGYVRADPPAPDPVPGTTYTDKRILFIGVGIGGNQQTGPIPGGGAGTPDTDYPGGNTQSDADPTVLGLERPVRVRVDTPTTWCRWVVPVSLPAGSTGFPATYPYTWVRFRGTFDLLDINTGVYDPGGILPATYPVVPVAELALYTYDATANDGDQYVTVPPGVPPAYALTQAVAYSTIPTFNKTTLNSLVVDWEIRVK